MTGDATAADFAAMLTGSRSVSSEPDHAPDTAALKAEAARRHGIPDALASRLVGSTAAEIEADAETLAEFTGKSEPEHVVLARRAIASAEAARQREAETLAALFAPSERSRKIVEAFHPTQGADDE